MYPLPFNTLVPKLIAEDKPLLSSLLTGVFPGRDVIAVRVDELQREIENLCTLRNLECTPAFLEKCLQLFSIQCITHGVMMVGAVGTGKSCVWRTLMDAMEKLAYRGSKYGCGGPSYVFMGHNIYSCPPNEKLDGTKDIHAIPGQNETPLGHPFIFAPHEKLDGTKGESHIVDPKVLSKEELYGRLDNTTLTLFSWGIK